MNWILATFPSFEEGWPRRSNKCDVTLKVGAAGEVKRLGIATVRVLQLLQDSSDIENRSRNGSWRY